jgi:hypothetical protein
VFEKIHEPAESGNKQSFDPKLKDAAKENPGEQVGSGKAGPDDLAKAKPGTAKDEGPPSKDAKAGEPTSQDVQHLKDLMQNKGGVGDLAAKALSQVSKNAADPDVRKQAKDALDESGRKVADPTPKDVDRLKDLLDRKDPIADLAARELGDIAKNAPDPNVRKQAKDALDKVDKAPGNVGDKSPPKSSAGDDGKGDAARKDLARFGGNLQLEDFLKRATPAWRAKAGITDHEWRNLLAKSAQYDDLLRKLAQQPKNKGPLDVRSKGRFDGSGLRHVESSQNAADLLDGGQAVTPPELQDAQRRFQKK